VKSIKDKWRSDKNNILAYVLIATTFLITEPIRHFFTIYQRDLGFDLVVVGIVGAAGSMMAMLSHFVSGGFSDHKGRKRPLITIILFSVLYPLSLLFFQSSSALLLIELFRSFITTAFYTIIIAYLYDTNSPSKAGRVYASALMAIAAIYLVSPLLGGLIIEHLSYRWLFSLSSYAVIIPLILLYFLKDPQVKKQEKSFGGEFIEILKLPPFIKIWITMVIISFSAGFIGQFFPIYLREVIGLSYVEIGAFLTGTGLLLTASHPLIGWLADRFKSRIIIPLGLFILAISNFFAGTNSNMASLFISRTMIPISMTLSRVKGSAVIANLTPREENALAHAMFKSSSAIGWTVINIVSPSLIVSIGYSGIFQALAGISALTGFAYLATYRHKEKSTAPQEKKRTLKHHFGHHTHHRANHPHEGEFHYHTKK